MKRYEYAVEKIVKDVDTVLNEMGKIGWLLITINDQLYYFCREYKGE
jgi:hypothetical protein